ncbi:MAG: efflux RND transporter periplasmic adaptor subunit [Paucibacter sp.]|nr:efflux RND transporter periplasmic adaptor subunit [Roseateles sp.]
MHRKLSLALTFAALLVLGGGGWWIWQQQQARTAGKDGTATAKAGPQAVGIFIAVQQDVPVTIEASGTVAALNLLDIRAQTTSLVKEVLIKDGQTVRKGDLLFRFDDRAARAELDKARAQMARDRSSLADLQRQHQRAVDLRAQNFVAQSAVDTALSNLEAQRSLLQLDEAAVQAAQVALSYNEIRSPMAGRAGNVNVVAGSLVQANSSALPLVSIAQINPIAVGFTLPETQLSALLQATRLAKAEPLMAQVLIPGAPTAAPQGRITFVDNLVDAASGTIKAKAEFDNAQQLLWPGQYMRVRLQLRVIKDATVIPVAAIIQRGNERSVFVVDANKLAQQLPVQIRHAFGEMAVVDGLKPGDKVVLDGKQNLRPGAAVKEQAAAVNPAAAAKRAASAASSS